MDKFELAYCTILLNHSIFSPIIGPIKKKTESDQLNLWNRLCNFTNKTENFTQSEMAGFFESISTNCKARSLYGYKSKIMPVYNIQTRRNFDVDFPYISDFILKKIHR